MKRERERECSSPTIGGTTMGDVYVVCGSGAPWNKMYDDYHEITLAQLNRLVLDHLREKAQAWATEQKS